MFGIFVISFQVLMVLLFGIFIRVGTASTTAYSFNQPFVFLLGYTLISIKFKLYDWTTIINLVFISAITFQWNTLFYIFWSSCVNNSFTVTSYITS